MPRGPDAAERSPRSSVVSAGPSTAAGCRIGSDPSAPRYRAAAAVADAVSEPSTRPSWSPARFRAASQRRLERLVVGHLDRSRNVARREHLEQRTPDRVVDRIGRREPIAADAAGADRGEKGEELVFGGRPPLADGDPTVRAHHPCSFDQRHLGIESVLQGVERRDDIERGVRPTAGSPSAPAGGRRPAPPPAPRRSHRAPRRDRARSPHAERRRRRTPRLRSRDQGATCRRRCPRRRRPPPTPP